jgi:hypothetical protein
MKNKNHSLLFLLMIVAVLAVGCNSERRVSGKGCGCGIHKGYVGY